MCHQICRRTFRDFFVSKWDPGWLILPQRGGCWTLVMTHRIPKKEGTGVLGGFVAERYHRYCKTLCCWSCVLFLDYGAFQPMEGESLTTTGAEDWKRNPESHSALSSSTPQGGALEYNYQVLGLGDTAGLWATLWRLCRSNPMVSQFLWE